MARRYGEALELARTHVVRQKMPAWIWLHTGRSNARLLHTVHNRIIAEVGREIKLPVRFDKAYMALALRNAARPFFARGLVQIAQTPYHSRSRVVGEHTG